MLVFGFGVERLLDGPAERFFFIFGQNLNCVMKSTLLRLSAYNDTTSTEMKINKKKI